MNNIHARHIGAVAILVFLLACGGGGGPTAPSGGTGSGGGGGTDGGTGGGTSGATITIAANGAVSPAAVTINVGQTVTFTNNSSAARNMFSDPHPSHGDCTALNSVNQLAPGQSKQTGAFTTARTCGYHDHDDPFNAGLKGTITIR